MNLAKMIGPAGPGVELLQAIVTAAPSGGTCTIRFGDLASTTTDDDIAGVHYLSDVGDGDTVWVLQTGGALLVLGSLATGWTEAASFDNGWVNYGGLYPTAASRRVGDIVYLKGLLKNGTMNDPCIYLPVGCYPTKNRHFIVMCAGQAGGLRIATDGSVTFGSPDGGGNGYCSLDGIHFETSG